MQKAGYIKTFGFTDCLLRTAGEILAMAVPRAILFCNLRFVRELLTARCDPLPFSRRLLVNTSPSL